MARDFIAIITDPKRGAEWEAILGPGIRTVHIKSPIPIVASVPGHTGELIYLLDTTFLQPDQRERLIKHIAKKFGLPEASVNQEIDEHGVPILAKDCVVAVANPQRWF